METKIMSAKKFWEEKFGEKSKTDADKLAVAMMQEYSQYRKNIQMETPKDDNA